MIRNKILTHVQCGCLFLLSLVAAPPAWAQAIEEIIVTATKRETGLQDTALSITAVGESNCNVSAPKAYSTMAPKFPTWVSAMRPMGVSMPVRPLSAVWQVAGWLVQQASISMIFRCPNT